MPTIFTYAGHRVVIYSNDHRPAHVHVLGSGCEAVFELDCPSGPPCLRENYGYTQKYLGRLVGALMTELGQLCWRWEDIHGVH
jgi:hypothetical protein